jgi:branched-chain amino acid transport system substrate-binding protein
MKTTLCIAIIAGTGCAQVLDIPDREFKCEVKVLGLYDATGGTRDVGVPFWKAQTDLIQDINLNNGIGGCTINAEFTEYGYNSAKATMIYEEDWRKRADWDEVDVILGWGSNDALALAPRTRDDRKPFLSASYIGTLAAPEQVTADVRVPELSPQTFNVVEFPQSFMSEGFAYNFFAGTDYSTSARHAMLHIQAQGGKRVGFFYCSADYCKGPIPAAREYARQLGLSLGRDQIVELSMEPQAVYDTKVREYFLAEKNRRAVDPTYAPVDWIWGGNTTTTSAFLAKAVGKLRTDSDPELAAMADKVQIIINVWGFDETLFTACAVAGQPNPCIDRVHGIMPFAAYGDTSPSVVDMAKVTSLHERFRTPAQESFKNVRYVQGYVNVHMLRLAIERVIAEQMPMNGESIKLALESFRAVDTGGLTGKLTFTETDHRPHSTVSIYKFNTAGALVRESERTLTMERSWLGW